MNNKELALTGILVVIIVCLAIQIITLNVPIEQPCPPVIIQTDYDHSKPVVEHTISTVVPVTAHTPIDIDYDTDTDDNVVFQLEGIHEFDRHTDISYPYDRTTDIDEEMTIMMWFKRDVFNTQQFLISKGHHGDRQGWRLMIKQTKPPYQYEQIQFDVGNKASLNYYKTLDGIVDHEWHSLVILFNSNKIYVDSKGTETHGVIILDGKAEYYMACPPEDKGNPPIDDVSLYRAPMYIGRHSDQKNKYYFTGSMSNVTIMDVDIGISAAQNWHETTKAFIYDENL